MSNDQRRIGFAASSHPRAVSIPEHFDFLRPTVPSKSFTTSNSSSLAFASSELLRFDSSLAAFRPEPHLPLGFWPSSRLHPCAATSSRRLPAAASFRHQVFSTSRRLSPHSGLQAYSIPLPRPGFLPVQGLLSPRSHPSSSEGASPRPLLPRLAHRLSPAAARRGPRLRGLHPREAAFAAVPLFTVLRAAPLLGFRSSRHLTSFGWTRLTHVLRSRRFFAPPSLFAIVARLRPQRLSRSKPGVASPLRLPARAFEPFLQPSVPAPPTHRPLPCDDLVREFRSSPAWLPSRSIPFFPIVLLFGCPSSSTCFVRLLTVLDSFTMIGLHDLLTLRLPDA
jgi:hypothetical protein